MRLTLARKRQIDILLPTVLATIAGIYAFRKKGADYRILVIAVLGAFLVSYIIVTQVTKMIYASGPSAVAVPPGAESFNGMPMAQRLRDDCYDFFSMRDYSLYEDFLKLTDGQIIQVYNAFNKNFFAEYNETLTQAIADEGFGWVYGGLKDSVLSRMQSLNLQ